MKKITANSIPGFILLNFIFLLSLKPVSASHMMGADMRYECIGAGKYKLIATLYRDCRGVALNAPTFGVFSSSSTSSNCGGFTISLSRISIDEVTPLCDTAKKRCSPANTGGTGAGVERHIYETTIDFNQAPYKSLTNNSCCNITFYVQQCCRNGSITTGPAGDDFITYCTLNLCNVGSGCNNSPVFSNPPIFYTCCNLPYRYNHGLIDTADNDSIVFHLSPALKQAGPDVSVSYINPYNFHYPVTPYCVPNTTIKCAADPLASTPKGFYFDSLNGDMVYTPVKCDEVAIVCAKATEYRKKNGSWVEVGSTRRDLQVEVRSDCSYNMVPEVYGNFDTCVKEGDTIEFEISTLDTLITGKQTSGDSVTLTWNQGIKGATFTLHPSKNPKATFRWVVPTGSTRSQPYSFSVHLIDNHCPLRAEIYKGFNIYVGDCSRMLNVHPVPDKPGQLYPQPVAAGGILHISGFNDGNAACFQINGRKIADLKIADGKIQIPADMQPGLYILQGMNQGKPAVLRVLIGE